jgi:signal transduction histidine kinase
VKVRDLQHLAAAMAHEVRNPLNSMAIHIELLEGRLRKEGLTKEDRDAATRSTTVLAAEIERVDKILEEYLSYAGPEEAARTPVDAERLLAEAVQRARPEAEKRSIGLEVKRDGALGTWAVDAEALGEAIDALLGNAVQASPKGGIIEVTARSVDDQAEVVVTDRGEGITKEDLARVFHLGFSKRGRSGVGLTVAKQIVKGHGGSIIAQSAGPGKGATFTLRMPLEADAGSDDLDDELDDDA